MTRIDERLTDEGANTMPLDAAADEIEEIIDSANSVSEELPDWAEPDSAGVSASSTIARNEEHQWSVDENKPSIIIPIDSKARVPKVTDDLGVVARPTDTSATKSGSTEIPSRVRGASRQKPPGGNTKATDEELPVSYVLSLVTKEKHELFCDRSGQPRLRIIDDPLNRTWLVHSRRTESWIAEVCHRSGVYPKPAVIKQIVTVLEGIAWNNHKPLTDVGYLDAVAAEPLVGVLDGFLETNPTVEFSPTELLAKLSEMAKNRYENVWQTRWPKSSSAFTRRLRENKEILSELGISISFDRDSDRRSILVSKNSSQHDDDAVMPSPAPSDHNSKPEHGFPRDDGNVEPDWRQLLEDELEARKARPAK